MRAVSVWAILAVAACVDQAPTNVASNASRTPSFSVTQQANPVVFNVQLLPENEPNGASNSEARGSAQVKIYDDGTMEFLFTVNNKGDETFTRSHIHKGAVGVNGPIHWDFLEPADPATSISDQPAQLRGIARARAAAVLADLLANPSGYYVNVHSSAFPGGAVRGQLQ
jgi:CHRD domain-containing protein